MPQPHNQPRQPKADRGDRQPRLRADGRWELRLSVRSGGSPRRKSIYGRSKEDCLSNAKPYLEVRAKAGDAAGLDTRLAAVNDKWLSAIEPPTPTNHAPFGLDRRTWEGYEAHVRLHIDPYLGHVPIALLRLNDVEDWQAKLLKEKMSGAMRGKVLNTLRTIINWAIRHDYVPGRENVASWAAMPGVVKQRWKPIDETELVGILHAIEGHRLEALCKTALMLGPRLSEATGLWIDDFDRERRVLHINHSLAWAHGGYPLLDGVKTAASERTIALPDSLVAALERHLGRREAEKKAAGDKWQEYGLLFTRPNGRPLRGDGTGGVGDQFKRCLKRAGLPARNFHQLRHQAASLLLALNGNNYFEVARILGHSTFRLTLDLYGHLIPEIQRQRADDVDAFYRGLATSGRSDKRE